MESIATAADHNHLLIKLDETIGTDQSQSRVFDFGCKTVGRGTLTAVTSGPVSVRFLYGPREDLLICEEVGCFPGSGEQSITLPGSHLALRYFRIDLEPGGERVTVDLIRLNLEKIYWQEPASGSFSTNDDELNRIWNTAVRTNQLCVLPGPNTIHPVHRLFVGAQGLQDAWDKPPEYLIVDGPRRDVESWIGDVRVQALGLYYSHGAYPLVEATLRHFARLQSPDGRIPASTSSLQQFASYVCWWVISLYECYLHGGNRNFLEEMRPALLSATEWMLRKVDDEGAFQGDRDWMWTIARQPASPASQSVYIHALGRAELLARELGDDSTADQCLTTELLARNYYKTLTRDRRDGAIVEKLQIETPEVPIFQDSNCMPIVFGLESSAAAQAALNHLRSRMWTDHGSLTTDVTIAEAVVPKACSYYDIFPVSKEEVARSLPDLTWAHTRQIWPFANAYEVQARLMSSDVAGAIELTRRCWSTFLREAPGTCWEMVDGETGNFPGRPFLADGVADTYNSACHGWSGWISYVLSAWLLGIRPLSPGFATTLFRPLPGGPRVIRGVVPTPYGEVRASVLDEGNRYEVELDSPSGIRVECDMSQLEHTGKPVTLEEKKHE